MSKRNHNEMKKTNNKEDDETSQTSTKATRKNKKDLQGEVTEVEKVNDDSVEMEEEDAKPVYRVISPPQETVLYFELEQLKDINLDERLVLWNDKGVMGVGLEKAIDGKKVVTILSFKLIGSIMYESTSGEGGRAKLKDGAFGKPKLSVTICDAPPNEKVTKIFPKIRDDVKYQFTQLQKISNAILDFKLKNPNVHSKLFGNALKIAKTLPALKKLADNHPAVLAKIAEEFRHPKAGFKKGFEINSESGQTRYGCDVSTIKASVEPYTRATPKAEAYRLKQKKYDVMNAEIQEAANDPKHEFHKLATSIMTKMTQGIMIKKKDSNDEELQKMFFSQVEVFDKKKHYTVFERKTTRDSFVEIAVTGDVFNTDEMDGLTWRLNYIIPIYKAPYVPYEHEDPTSSYALPESMDDDDDDEANEIANKLKHVKKEDEEDDYDFSNIEHVA